MANLRELTAGKSAAAERFMADLYKSDRKPFMYAVFGNLLVQYGELIIPAHNDTDGYVKWVLEGDNTCERILYVSGDWQQGGGWYHTTYDKKGNVIAVR